MDRHYTCPECGKGFYMKENTGWTTHVVCPWCGKVLLKA